MNGRYGYGNFASRTMFWVANAVVVPNWGSGNYSDGDLYRVKFFFSSRRRHTRLQGDWSSDVCSSDLSHRSRPPALAPIADLSQVSSIRASGDSFRFDASVRHLGSLASLSLITSQRRDGLAAEAALRRAPEKTNKGNASMAVAGTLP